MDIKSSISPILGQYSGDRVYETFRTTPWTRRVQPVIPRLGIITHSNIR